eukprot:gnl/MRDRNA2_/MRDRNA2_169229_c0_seq1.p1 gnl/MRDRNA2_/MRDRNA2_169229_c0~~gnl/MRDRNA2_/MRDRNA2_169229_c0_seq1.p1  ORF type:complete len:205 (-),score=34.48 gnl/MRDRNA2_/MRDRNA2_169229_c0_seq1:145-672(-)
MVDQLKRDQENRVLVSSFLRIARDPWKYYSPRMITMKSNFMKLLLEDLIHEGAQEPAVERFAVLLPGLPASLRRKMAVWLQANLPSGEEEGISEIPRMAISAASSGLSSKHLSTMHKSSKEIGKLKMLKMSEGRKEKRKKQGMHGFAEPDEAIYLRENHNRKTDGNQIERNRDEI